MCINKMLFSVNRLHLYSLLRMPPYSLLIIVTILNGFIHATMTQTIQTGRFDESIAPKESGCPNAEDIMPCECYTYPSQVELRLRCDNVTSEDELKHVFEAYFPNKNFKSFSMNVNEYIKTLEAGIFNDVTFEDIIISYSRLEVIATDAFNSSYNTIKTMNFLFSDLLHLPFVNFHDLKKLQSFQIVRNSLSFIHAETFYGLDALEMIVIRQTTANITGTFQNIPNLINLELRDNNLTSVPTHFCKTGSTNIKKVDLAFNRISEVADDAFDAVAGMSIDIHFNLLTELPESTWRPLLEAGVTVNAFGNPLLCGCDIAWMFDSAHLVNHMSYGTECDDGNGTLIHNVDPSIFDNC
ncbi:unnamed protein product [Meganyctiphanes norvegica]|uniref:Oplophorus-luciferin 2-monooxygenase non-catalytic subunit n=1 Tax=Meganyctiphanes norvegica TaxID=48144 RepID=A0AAV2QSG0_MEGNR